MRACAGLAALRLLRCGGPLGDELGAALAARRPREHLTELVLLGGAERLSDAGLALLASPCAPAAWTHLKRSGLPEALVRHQPHARITRRVLRARCRSRLSPGAAGAEARHWCWRARSMTSQSTQPLMLCEVAACVMLGFALSSGGCTALTSTRVGQAFYSLFNSTTCFACADKPVQLCPCRPGRAHTLVTLQPVHAGATRGCAAWSCVAAARSRPPGWPPRSCRKPPRWSTSRSRSVFLLGRARLRPAPQGALLLASLARWGRCCPAARRCAA